MCSFDVFVSQLMCNIFWFFFINSQPSSEVLTVFWRSSDVVASIWNDFQLSVSILVIYILVNVRYISLIFSVLYSVCVSGYGHKLLIIIRHLHHNTAHYCCHTKWHHLHGISSAQPTGQRVTFHLCFVPLSLCCTSTLG